MRHFVLRNWIRAKITHSFITDYFITQYMLTEQGAFHAEIDQNLHPRRG